MTPEGWAAYEKWFGLAVDDPTISRFSYGQAYLDRLKAMPTSTWDIAYFVQCKGLGLGYMSFDRPARSAKPTVLVVDSPQNRIVGGLLFRRLLIEAKRNNSDWIESSCSETNVPSVAIHQKLFGDPWGTEPHSNFDPALGQFVPRIYFKARLDVLLEKRKGAPA